jgi:hypothetical protein
MLIKSGDLEYWLEIADEEAIARGLKLTKGNPGTDNAQDRLGIDSWGGRKRKPEHDGIDRRSKIRQKAPQIDRRKLA